MSLRFLPFSFQIFRRISISLLFVLTYLSSIASAEVVIIANKSVEEDRLPVADVVRIFLGEKRKWANNDAVIVVLNRSEDIHMELMITYVRRTPSQFRNVWKRLVFTGEGKYPIVFADTSQLIDYVASRRGAVSYIDAGDVTDKVKVINVE